MTRLPIQNVADATAQVWWPGRARWIYDALLAGELCEHATEGDVRYPVSVESIGVLDLPRGELVVVDPYVSDDAQPFEQALGADRVEVVAARALIAEGHERIAAVVLIAGPGPVVEWVLATLPGQDVTSLERDGFFGFGVDAGTAGFGGVAAMEEAGRVLFEDAGMLEDPMSVALFSDGIGTRSACLVPPVDGATPIALCSSGWGDGMYPTWLGVDSSGSVAVSVTDFLITTDPFDVEAPEPVGVADSSSASKTLLGRLLKK